MSITLNNQLEKLMFSSQIPDIEIASSDDIEVVVFESTPNAPL